MRALVAIVEDSPIATMKLERIFERHGGIHTVARFASVEALEKAASAATVVVLDVFLEGQTGLSSVRDLAARVGVVVVSDAEADSRVANEALARGAHAFVSKRELATAGGEARLCQAVLRACERPRQPVRRTLIVVGSTGAHRAWEALAPKLGSDSPPLVIVQHLPEGGAKRFAQWLTTLGLPTQVAHDRASWLSRPALIAPGGLRTLLGPGGVVRVQPASPTDLYTPSADLVMRSAASLDLGFVAVVLSGMGRDGSEGAKHLAEAGHPILTQLPDECAAPSMPSQVLRACPSARAVSLAQLPDAIRDELRVALPA